MGVDDGGLSELVELVDEDGRTVGTTGKLAAHQPPGRLHRAVSVFLLDGRDRRARTLGRLPPVCGIGRPG